MTKFKKSLVQMDTLKPDLEFKVIKLILLRENYIKRIRTQLKNYRGVVNENLVRDFDLLRDVSIETIETMRLWERSQVTYPITTPFLWNGEVYLRKMNGDMSFLHAHHSVEDWLGYDSLEGPFLVPRQILEEVIPDISTNYYITFGSPPKSENSKKEEKSRNVTTLFKSPYFAPIVNDTSLLPRTRSKNVRRKTSASAVYSRVMNDTNSNEALEGAEVDYNPFECIVSKETVDRMKSCWRYLCSSYGDIGSPSNDLNMSGMTPSSTSEFMDSSAKNVATSDAQGLEWNKSPSTAAFFERLDATATPKPRHNSTFRLVPLTCGEDSFDVADDHLLGQSQNRDKGTLDNHPSSASNAHIWTPHEIILQKAVLKRGGDLFALTAATTMGRVKAPWRRTRLERMETDLAHLVQQSEALQMAAQDFEMKLEQGRDSAAMRESVPMVGREAAEGVNIAIAKSPDEVEDKLMRVQRLYDEVRTQLKFLKYQRDHFYMIIKDRVDGLERKRAMAALPEGSTLPPDEALSFSLEERMAATIQRQIRKKFGRTFIKTTIGKRSRAAVQIQKAWRRKQDYDTTVRLKEVTGLAINVQRIWRGRTVREAVMAIRYEALRQSSAKIIQRIWRGGRGRLRALLKREFLASIAAANACVSLGLNPTVVDELAEEVELYLKDYNRNLPIELLTLLRAVLFMLNGDDPEPVLRENLGMLEVEYLRAHSLSWFGANKLLRRKAKLLRRLRSLALSIKSPDASRLYFINDCLSQLSYLVSNVTEKQLSEIHGPGKQAAINLLQYARNLKRAHDLQQLFPEHFEVLEPHWLHIILQLCREYQRADVENRVLRSSLHHLQKKQEMALEKGMKFGFITAAKDMIQKSFIESKASQSKIHEKFKYATDHLHIVENKRLKALEEFEKAKSEGLHIAQREVEDLISLNIRDQDRMSESLLMVDERMMMYIEARAILASTRARIARDREQRDFKKLVNFDVSHERCTELGEIEADLLVLQNEWNRFFSHLGGLQHVADMTEAHRRHYEEMINKINKLVMRRRVLQKEIEEDIDRQLKSVSVNARSAREEALRSGTWDQPSDIEIEGETREDETCARAETTLQAAKDKAAVDRVVHSAAVVPPIMLVIDVHIPKSTKSAILQKLQPLNFQDFVEQDVDVSDLLPQLQFAIEEGKHVILYADFGIHSLQRIEFITKFRNVILALSPKPIVVGVDGFQAFHFTSWYSSLGIEQSCVIRGNGHHQETAVQAKKPISERAVLRCLGGVGKARQLADLFKFNFTHEIHKLDAHDTLLHITEAVAIPDWLVQQFHEDWRDFLRSVHHHLLERTSHDDSLAKNPDCVIASILAYVSGKWRAPIRAWSSADIKGAILAFENVTHNLSDLFKLLSLTHLPDTSPLSLPRYERILELKSWRSALPSLVFYEQPARYLLSQWCDVVVNLMVEIIHKNGTVVYNDQMKQLIPHMHNFHWKHDICSHDLEHLLSCILRRTFHDCLVHQEMGISVPIMHYVSSEVILGNFNKKAIKYHKEKRNINIYHYKKEIYLSVESANENSAEQPASFSFVRVPVAHFIDMMKPTFVEMYEGRVQDIKLDFSKDNWINYLTSWSLLENMYNHRKSSILSLRLQRCSNVLLTKQGIISGYHCRVVVTEEVKQELVISVYGLTGHLNIPIKIEIKFHELQQLQKHSDYEIERNALLNHDAPRIAAIFSDRIRISPAKKWSELFGRPSRILDTYQEQMKISGNSTIISQTRSEESVIHTESLLMSENHNQSLQKFSSIDNLSSEIHDIHADYLSSSEQPSVSVSASAAPLAMTPIETVVKIRYAGGPGRYTGTKVICRNGRRLLISVYEMFNDSDVHGLRLCTYDRETRRTIEFRVSALEKVLLFSDSSKSLWEQINDRLDIIYCDFNKLKHEVMLRVFPNPKEVKTYPEEKASDTVYHLGSYQPDKEEDGDEEEDRFDSDAEKPSESIENGTENTEQAHSVTDENTDKKAPNWCWAVTVDRGITVKVIENVSISIGINLDHECFTFSIKDRITTKREMRWLSFDEFCQVFPEYSSLDLKTLMNSLRSPKIISDLLSRIPKNISLKRGRREGVFKTMLIQLKGDKKFIEPVVIGVLREHVLGEPDSLDLEPHDTGPNMTFPVLQRMRSRKSLTNEKETPVETFDPNTGSGGVIHPAIEGGARNTRRMSAILGPKLGGAQKLLGKLPGGEDQSVDSSYASQISATAKKIGNDKFAQLVRGKSKKFSNKILELGEGITTPLIGKVTSLFDNGESAEQQTQSNMLSQGAMKRFSNVFLGSAGATGTPRKKNPEGAPGGSILNMPIRNISLLTRNLSSKFVIRKSITDDTVGKKVAEVKQKVSRRSSTSFAVEVPSEKKAIVPERSSRRYSTGVVPQRIIGNFEAESKGGAGLDSKRLLPSTSLPMDFDKDSDTLTPKSLPFPVRQRKLIHQSSTKQGQKLGMMFQPAEASGDVSLASESKGIPSTPQIPDKGITAPDSPGFGNMKISSVMNSISSTVAFSRKGLDDSKPSSPSTMNPLGQLSALTKALSRKFSIGSTHSPAENPSQAITPRSSKRIAPHQRVVRQVSRRMSSALHSSPRSLKRVAVERSRSRRSSAAMVEHSSRRKASERDETRSRDSSTGTTIKSFDPRNADDAGFMPARKMILSVQKAVELGKPSRFVTPSPCLFVTWNGEDMGHTIIEKYNQNPVWGNNFIFRTTEGEELSANSLNMAVYDMHGDNKGPFLGSVTLEGDSMTEFVEKSSKTPGEVQWFELKRNPGIEEKANRYVQGKIGVTLQASVIGKAGENKATKLNKFFGTDGPAGGKLARGSSVTLLSKGPRQGSNKTMSADSEVIVEEKSTDSLESRYEDDRARSENLTEFSPMRRLSIHSNIPYLMIHSPLDKLRKHWRYTWSDKPDHNHPENFEIQFEHQHHQKPHHLKYTSLYTKLSRRYLDQSSVSVKTIDDAEYRVCWRSCVMPSNVIFTRTDSEVNALSRRCDRIVKIETVNDIPIVSKFFFHDKDGLDDEKPVEANSTAPSPVKDSQITRQNSGHDQQEIAQEGISSDNPVSAPSQTILNIRGLMYPQSKTSTAPFNQSPKKHSLFMTSKVKAALQSIEEGLLVHATVGPDNPQPPVVLEPVPEAVAEHRHQLATAFPICVKEILTHGVGLVERKYRIEVYSNTGLLIASIDISSGEEMARVVGKDHIHMILSTDINLPKVFEHVVKNRLILEFPNHYDDKSHMDLKEEPQKDFGWGSSYQESLAGAILTLNRDEDIREYLEQSRLSSYVTQRRAPSIHKEITQSVSMIRIFTKWQKISGTNLLTTILISSPSKNLAEHTDKFFVNLLEDNEEISGNEAMLEKLNDNLVAIFRVLHMKTKQSSELCMPLGDAFRSIIPSSFSLNNQPIKWISFFGSRLRRYKLGTLLLDRLSLQYSEFGDYILTWK